MNAKEQTVSSVLMRSRSSQTGIEELSVAMIGKRTTGGSRRGVGRLGRNSTVRLGALRDYTMRECPDYSQPDHRFSVRNFFRLNPDLETLFGRAWIDAAVQPLKQRSDLPPIFWALANPASHKRLAQALKLISEQRRSIRHIIAELSSPDEKNVSALLAELEVFRMIRLRNDSVKWKPPTLSPGGRSPDLGLIWKGRPMFLEIFTIGQAEEERNQRLALDMVQRFVNHLQNHRYFISFEVKGEFLLRYVRKCCLFLKAAVEDLVLRRVETSQCDYRVAGQIILKIEFNRRPDCKGSWVSTMHGMRESTKSGRIKMKMLDKLDGFQFPRNMDSINGYVLVVDEMFNDQETVNSAVVGRVGVRVQSSGGVPRMEWVRQPDGTIHDETRAELLVEHIDFIASLKEQGGLSLGPLGLIMNGDLKRITREEAWALLWDTEPDSK